MILAGKTLINIYNADQGKKKPKQYIQYKQGKKFANN